MAKLKCDLHKERVFAIRGTFIHRGGWGAVCSSTTATIGDKKYTAEEIDRKGSPLKNDPSAEKLLKEVFEEGGDG